MRVRFPICISGVHFAGSAYWKTSEVNTVAFLPTAGIFKDLEGVYLLENNWSGREDLNLRPPGPELGCLEPISLLLNHLSGASTVSFLLNHASFGVM
jgi:hypothetical protein